MSSVATSEPDRQLLIDHLEVRFANGDIERALGGFALLLMTFYDGDKNGRALDVPIEKDMLTAISARLRKTLRDSDFVTQFDEQTFAVVIPQISDRATVERIIQKLSTAFLLPITNGESEQARTLSPKFGFSLFPSDGATQQALIARAREAM